MNTTDKDRKYLSRVTKFALILGVAWTLILGVSLIWRYISEQNEARNAASVAARAQFSKDVLYRRWNAGHGGVYVPISESIQPNPFLTDIEKRDIETTSGRKLTLINPAFMTRQVHELGQESEGVLGHITSLNPIRPANIADSWEKRALESFEQGEGELASIEILGGKPHLRLMRPLSTEKGCLKCHAKQGYREGDVRGGISVSIPMAPYVTIARSHLVISSIAHGALWVLGLGALAFGNFRIGRYEAERMRAEEALRENEAWLRSVFRVAPTGIGVVTNRVLKQVNERMCLMTAYSEEDLIGRNSRMLYLNDEDYECVGREKYKQISAHGTGTMETRWKCNDGRVIDVLLSSTPLDLEDLSKGVTFTALDITERKRAREELQKNERKFRSLFEQAGDYILVLEISKDRGFVVSDANKAACEVHGYPLLGSPLLAHVASQEGAHHFRFSQTQPDDKASRLNALSTNTVN